MPTWYESVGDAHWLTALARGQDKPALASRWQIPVFNLARPDATDRLGDFLSQAE